MYYFKFNIGDYLKETRGFSAVERAMYLELVIAYYDSEGPLPIEVDEVCLQIGVSRAHEKRAVAKVLARRFEKGPAGHVHQAIQSVITVYQGRVEQNRENANKNKARCFAAPNFGFHDA